MSASGGQATSSPAISSPFGGFPNRVARQTFNNLIGPLSLGLGLGGGRRAQRFNQRLDAGEFGGPLGTAISQIQGFAPGIIPGAEAAAAQISSQAPISFDQLRGQVSTALSDLTGLREQSGDLTTRARDLVDQAFSPIAGRALFNETFNRAVDPLRQGLSARGLLDSGTGADVERGLGTDLALNFAANDQANQANALGVFGNAINNQLGVTSAGVPLANAELAGLGTLGQLLQFANTLPLASAGNLLSLLTGGVTPGIQLTQSTAPVVGSESKDFNQSAGLTCIPLGTPVLLIDLDTHQLHLRPIETVTVGDVAVSISDDGTLIAGRVAALVERATPPAHPITRLTVQHLETGAGSAFAMSTTHPLGDGRLARDLVVGDRWGAFVIIATTTLTIEDGVTRDLLIESPTGLYCVGPGFVVGSTLDGRHRPDGRPVVPAEGVVRQYHTIPSPTSFGGV